MAICSMCGREFDLTYARRVIGKKYGAGTYNDEYPDGDVCESCVDEEWGASLSAGEEIQYLMARDHGELDELGWGKKKRDKFKEWWG